MVSPSHSAPPSMAMTTLRGTLVLRRDSRKVMMARLTDNFCHNPLNECFVAISPPKNLDYADQFKHEPERNLAACSTLRLRMGPAVFAGQAPVREDFFNGICYQGRSLSPPLAENEHDCE